jgi:hypothetical protein
MRARKLLQQTLELLGVTREELEHLVSCEKCVDPFDGEGSFHCREYQKQFWGYTPPEPYELTPQQRVNAKIIQDLWTPEILRQMPSALKFGEESNAPSAEA